MSEEILDDKSTLVLTSDISIDKNKAVYPFRNLSAESLKSKVNDLLLQSGYKTEVLGNETFYYRGSLAMRILFGAFAKYFRWKVAFEQEGEYTKLIFEKDAKGYAGGVIGVNQVNNEFKKITAALSAMYAETEK